MRTNFSSGRFGLTLVIFLVLLAIPTQGQVATIDTSKADDLFSHGKYQEATTEYNNILAVALSRNDKVQVERAYDRLTNVAVRLGRYDRAIGYCEKQAKYLDDNKDSKKALIVRGRAGGYLVTLGYPEKAEEYLKRVVAPDDSLKARAAYDRLVALTAWAQLQLGKKQEAEVAKTRAEILKLGEQLLKDPLDEFGKDNQPIIRREVALIVTNTLKALGRNDEALQRTTEYRQLFAGAWKWRRGERDMLSQIVKLQESPEQVGKKGPKFTSELARTLLPVIDEAIALNTAFDKENDLRLGELYAQRAELERSIDPNAVAVEADLVKAVDAWRRVLAAKDEDRTEIAKFDAAMHLLELDRWDSKGLEEKAVYLLNGRKLEDRVNARVITRVGSLRNKLRDHDQLELTRQLLARSAKQFQQAETYQDRVFYPRTLINLASVEMSLDRPDQSKEIHNLCVECRRFYDDSKLPRDGYYFETYSLDGIASALNGRFSDAVRTLEDGYRLCIGDEPELVALRRRILLNQAITYRLQGDFLEALAKCRQLINDRDFDKKSELALTLYCSMAQLHAMLGDFESSLNYVERAETTFKEKLTAESDSVEQRTLWHCRALEAFSRKDTNQAKMNLNKELKAAGGNPGLLARTHFYLGLNFQFEGDDESALAEFTLSRQQLSGMPEAFPVTQFTTLWQSADILAKRGDTGAAIKALEEATALAERARIQAYGDEKNRANLFNQFRAGFDRLTDLYVQTKQYDKAIALVTRNRNTTLFDQVVLEGRDFRQELRDKAKTDKRIETLLSREEKLRTDIDQLYLKLVQLRSGPERDQQHRLLTDKREELGVISRDLAGESKVYEQVQKPISFAVADLEKIRKEFLGEERILLFYAVGKSRSYLFIVTGKEIQVYPLLYPAKRVPLSYQKGDPLPPIDARMMRTIVEGYLNRMRANLVFAAEDLKDRDPRLAPVENPFDFRDSIIPEAARQYIAARRKSTRSVLVVPDGALHRLPLEAVNLDEDREYLIDRMPPMGYLPTLALYAPLAERRKALAALPPKPVVVSIANPPYISQAFKPLFSTRRDTTELETLFTPTGADVRSFRGDSATGAELRKNAEAANILYLGGHGESQYSSGSRFKFIALTNGAAKKQDELFNLTEIYNLKLPNCQLAVLSACQPRVGPDDDFDAGMSLGSAFLVSGAQRVLVTHWRLPDSDFGAEDNPYNQILAAVFRGLHNDWDKPQGLHIAANLHSARLAVKANESRSAPKYWGSFFLLGLPD